jgi:hypothetical protein
MAREIKSMFETIPFHLILLFVPFFASCEKTESEPSAEEEIVLQETVKIYNEDKFYEGYTLFSPLGSTETYLLNMKGDTIHLWESENMPGNSVYLLEDGSLLRTENTRKNNRFKGTGGIGGRVAKYNLDGNLTWSYTLDSDQMCLHHDVEPLPNGNILLVAWDM